MSSFALEASSNTSTLPPLLHFIEKSKETVTENFMMFIFSNLVKSIQNYRS